MPPRLHRGRRSDAASGDRSRPPDQGRVEEGAEAEALRPYLGQWVAQKGMEVMVAADTPEAVLAWLERHDQYADGVFRVPAALWEVEGVWPG